MSTTRGIGWRLSATTVLVALSISLFTGGELSAQKDDTGLLADGVGAVVGIPGAGAAVEVGRDAGVGVDVGVPGVDGSAELSVPDEGAILIEPTYYRNYRSSRYYYGRPYHGYYHYGRVYPGPYQNPYYYPYYDYYEYHNYNWGW